MRLRPLLILILLAGCGGDVQPPADAEPSEPDYPPPRPRIEEAAPSAAERSQYDEAHDLWYHDQPERAIPLFERFIQQHPDSPLADDAQRMIGTAYGNMERYDDALAAYREVGERYPASDSAPIALYDMAHMAFYDMNDFPAARRYYEQFLAVATVANADARGHAIDQLRDWTAQTERFEGYAERRDEDMRNIRESWQRDSPAEYLTIANHEWRKGGFGTVGLHGLTIENSADIDFKDVVVSVSYFAESGTLIDRRVVTIYKVFPAQGTVSAEEVNTGFVNSNAASARPEIVTAVPVE